MVGFFRMPRGWMDHPVFGTVKRAPLSRHAAWIWLIEKAAYRPTMVRFGSREIELQRGQYVSSLLHLGGEWGWDTMKVSRFISAIVSASMAEMHTEMGRTLITICNYEQFVGDDRLGETAENAHRASRWSATDTGTKEVKTSPIGEVTTARATRLAKNFQMPLDWIEDGQAAREKAHLPPADLATEAIKFTNHWLSKNGKDGAKLDWHRTWINWCLNARGHGNGRPPARPSGADNLVEGFGRLVGLSGGSGDRGADSAASGPLLDGEYVRLDA